MENTQNIKQSHKPRDKTDIKKILVTNLISIFALTLLAVSCSILIFIFHSLKNADLNEKSRYFWILFLAILGIAILFWLTLRIILCFYIFNQISKLKINKKINKKNTKIFGKLLYFSLNHYYFYKFLKIDVNNDKIYSKITNYSKKTKKSIFKQALFYNIYMTLFYLFWLCLILILGFNFSMFNDKYFWLIISIIIGYYFVKIHYRFYFLIYLTILKNHHNLSKYQYARLITLAKKSHNNLFLYNCLFFQK